jgi:hypothetical protein
MEQIRSQLREKDSEREREAEGEKPKKLKVTNDYELVRKR